MHEPLGQSFKLNTGSLTYSRLATMNVAMRRLMSLNQHGTPERPRTSLILGFVSWKLLLLTIACTSPYPGYDTSTTLSLPVQKPEIDCQHTLKVALQNLAGKLTKWDAIYFTRIAHRGALFEQEWAFNGGYARLLSVLCRSMPFSLLEAPFMVTDSSVQ